MGKAAGEGGGGGGGGGVGKESKAGETGGITTDNTPAIIEARERARRFEQLKLIKELNVHDRLLCVWLLCVCFELVCV